MEQTLTVSLNVRVKLCTHVPSLTLLILNGENLHYSSAKILWSLQWKSRYFSVFAKTLKEKCVCGYKGSDDDVALRCSPLLFQIWNNNVLRDQFMGKHVFLSADDMQAQVLEVDLFGRKSESTVQKPGKLYLLITQSRQLLSV